MPVDGDRFRPAVLLPSEHALLTALEGKSVEHPEMADWQRFNYPAWLDPHLKALFGDRLRAELTGLNGAAALDLRVNQLKSNRADARKALAARGRRCAADQARADRPPRAWAHTALQPRKLQERQRRGAGRGSQLAALLTEAKPGMRIVDFCAGAGGKTLALAAQMQNKGHLVACDVSETRLTRSAQRLRRAGISNVERRTLTSERDKWVKRHAGQFRPRLR